MIAVAEGPSDDFASPEGPARGEVDCGVEAKELEKPDLRGERRRLVKSDQAALSRRPREPSELVAGRDPIGDRTSGIAYKLRLANLGILKKKRDPSRSSETVNVGETEPPAGDSGSNNLARFRLSSAVDIIVSALSLPFEEISCGRGGLPARLDGKPIPIPSALLLDFILERSEGGGAQVMTSSVEDEVEEGVLSTSSMVKPGDCES